MRILWVIVLGLFLSDTATANPITVDSRDLLQLHEHSEILRGIPVEWGIEEILAADKQGKFNAFSGVAASASKTTATWLKLELQAAGEVALRASEKVLVAHAISQQNADFYVVNNGNIDVIHAGLDHAFQHSQRVNYRHPAIALSTAELPQTIYIRFYDQAGSVFPLELLNSSTFEQKRLQENLIFGAIFGIIIGLFFYNLTLYVQLRDSSYLWYVFTMAAALVLLLEGTGIGPQMLWPSIPHPWYLNRVSTAAMWGFSLIMFSLYFLQLRDHLPWTFRVLVFILVAHAAVYVLHAGGFTQYAAIVSNTFALISIPLLLVAAIWRFRQGFYPALFFTLAQSVMLLAALLMVMRQLALVKPEQIVSYWFPAAVALEAILFSLALAHRIGELKSQRYAAIMDAYHDSLTGALNRRGMMNQLSKLRGTQGYCLVLIDLDGFKAINDNCGHDVGDTVLQYVAKRVSNAVRSGQGWVVRFGGDEFGILIPNKLTAIQAFCERVRVAIEAPMHINGQLINVGASIGWHCADKMTEFEPVYRMADQAMYQNKQQRRLNHSAP